MTWTPSLSTLQPISAEVLNGFVVVYKAWIEGVTTLKTCAALPEKCANQSEKEIAAAKAKEAGEAAAKNEIKSGDPLGAFSFTAQTQ